MKHHYDNHGYSPFGFFLFMFLFMTLFGWKLFLLFPFFTMLLVWAMLAQSFMYDLEPIEVEKRKRKRKNDEYYWDDGDYV